MPPWLQVVLVVAAITNVALLVWFLIVLTRICWGVEATAEHARRMAPGADAVPVNKPSAEPDRVAGFAAIVVASVVAFLAGFLAASFYNYRP